MDRLRNILVAIDFSDCARTALVQGARLAARSGASLHVIHVVRDEHAADLQRVFPRSISALHEDLSRNTVRQVEEELRAIGKSPAASIIAVVGSPVGQIINAVRDLSADLLIVGATGESDRADLGTTAVRCVRKAPTKVLVIPKGCDGVFRKVVACVDFSQLSPVVLAQAARIAALDGGSVSAVHVYQMAWELARWGSPPEDAGRIETEFRSLMETRFRADRDNIDGLESVELTLVRHHRHDAGVEEFATSIDADLVVLGTTGRSALAYMLLGTTAENILRSIRRPVLAVKQAEITREQIPKTGAQAE